ncbi:hypothetical protein Taro_053142, partial [Colocasia esculenta]|nr:hypothetical protein [Colocasia esculenta]
FLSLSLSLSSSLSLPLSLSHSSTVGPVSTAASTVPQAPSYGHHHAAASAQATLRRHGLGILFQEEPNEVDSLYGGHTRAVGYSNCSCYGSDSFGNFEGGRASVVAMASASVAYERELVVAKKAASIARRLYRR